MRWSRETPMTTFLRKYPLFLVIVLNVFAVLTYDTLRQPSDRRAMLGAARSMTEGQASAGDRTEGALPFLLP